MKEYGIVKVTDYTGEREVAIVDFLQMEYTNCRLISCIKTEENAYILSVENPKSTGRAERAQIVLTEESLYGLLNTVMMFFSKNNVDVSKIMLEQYPHDEIRYMCPEQEQAEENIKMFDKQIANRLNELKVKEETK